MRKERLVIMNLYLEGVGMEDWNNSSEDIVLYCFFVSTILNTRSQFNNIIIYMFT